MRRKSINGLVRKVPRVVTRLEKEHPGKERRAQRMMAVTRACAGQPRGVRGKGP